MKMKTLVPRQSFSTTEREVERSDIITAASFSEDGSYIAVGDKGGRIWVYSTKEGKARCKSRKHEISSHQDLEQKNHLEEEDYCEYDIYGQFQSHETTFDYLKSQEIEQRINAIQWCQMGSSALTLLAANDKCIKLWKIFEKPILKPSFSLFGDSYVNLDIESLPIPRLNISEILTAAIPRRTYTLGHTYHINSLSLSSDGENFISADDLRVNLWSIESSNHTFCIADLKPESMEDLTCVIKHVEFHPVHCSIFSYGTSKGDLLLADLRTNSTVKKHSKIFHCESTRRDFFSDLTEQVLHSSFSKADINKVVVRDFKTIKVWDLRQESEPLRVIQLPGFSRESMEYLYRNEGIFDKFQVTTSASSTTLVTGVYSGEFIVSNWETGKYESYHVGINRLPPSPANETLHQNPSTVNQNTLEADDGPSVAGGGFSADDVSEKEDPALVNPNNTQGPPWIKSGIFLANFHPKMDSQVMVGSTCDIVLFGPEPKRMSL